MHHISESVSWGKMDYTLEEQFRHCLNHLERCILSSGLPEKLRERFLDACTASLSRQWSHLASSTADARCVAVLSTLTAEAVQHAVRQMQLVAPSAQLAVGLHEFQRYLRTLGQPEAEDTSPDSWAHQVAVVYLHLRRPTVRRAVVLADPSRRALRMRSVALALERKFWREIAKLRRALGETRSQQLKRCAELAEQLDPLDGVFLRGDTGRPVLVTGAIARMLLAIG